MSLFIQISGIERVGIVYNNTLVFLQLTGNTVCNTQSTQHT